MKDVLNAGIRLFLIAFVAAVALAATNMLTRGPIERQREEAEAEAFVAVMPGADKFEAVDPSVWANGGAYGSMDAVDKATKNGRLVGYTFALTPQGYRAEIPVTVGILADGTVVGVEIGDIYETAGIGTKIKDEEFLEQFSNRPAGDMAGVDTISRATVSSSAVKKAVLEAVRLFGELNGQGEAAGR